MSGAVAKTSYSDAVDGAVVMAGSLLEVKLQDKTRSMFLSRTLKAPGGRFESLVIVDAMVYNGRLELRARGAWA